MGNIKKILDKIHIYLNNEIKHSLKTDYPYLFDMVRKERQLYKKETRKRALGTNI